MSAPVRVIGSPLSPYVRKVLVCLAEKGIPYQIDPLVPFFGDDRFSRLSPMRRVPVFMDDQITLCDSSVICQYLEDRYPAPALYPADIGDRARARWLEEFADTQMGEVIIWRLYNQVIIRRFVWGEPPDAAVLQRARDEELPRILDYLEGLAPESGCLFGPVSIADISVASFFRNAAMARAGVDAARWPRTADYVERVLRRESFAGLAGLEARLLRTPIAEHRRALSEMGAPVLEETYAGPTPRR